MISDGSVTKRTPGGNEVIVVDAVEEAYNVRESEDREEDPTDGSEEAGAAEDTV